MGLAERKTKQRIGYDPRNLGWSEDKDRFGMKHMANLGWKENTGLGRDGSGNANHIAVVRKMDAGGIGMDRMRKEGKELSAGAGQAGAGLEDVLKRLAARASASASATPAASAPATPAETPASSPGPSVVRNKIASRQKHLRSKRMATQDKAALAAILGVSVDSLPATPAESMPTSGASTPAETESTPEPASATENSNSDANPERNALESITTSKLSVSDYFRMKLREKMLQRQATSGSATPAMSEGSLAVMKEEVKVDVGGVKFEGSKMQFGEADPVSLGDLGSDAPAINAERLAKEAKKAAKKEAKRMESQASTSTSTGESATSSSTSTPAPSDKESRRAEKEAKKAEKEAKKREKEEKKRSKEEKKSRKEETKAKKEEGGDKQEKKDKKRKRDADADEDSDEAKKSKSR